MFYKKHPFLIHRENNYMRIGIIGSREFPQLKLIEFFINDLPKGVTIVSGGAKGTDSYAIDCAKKKAL